MTAPARLTKAQIFGTIKAAQSVGLGIGKIEIDFVTGRVAIDVKSTAQTSLGPVNGGSDVTAPADCDEPILIEDFDMPRALPAALPEVDVTLRWLLIELIGSGQSLGEAQMILAQSLDEQATHLARAGLEG